MDTRRTNLRQRDRGGSLQRSTMRTMLTTSGIAALTIAAGLSIGIAQSYG